MIIYPSMVKPFRRVVGTPYLNLNHCLSDLLRIVNLLTHPRSTRRQIKVVNICVMHGTESLEVVVFLTDFKDM